MQYVYCQVKTRNKKGYGIEYKNCLTFPHRQTKMHNLSPFSSLKQHNKKRKKRKILFS